MNKVILIGRLTKDPELRYTGSNRAVTQITVAVNRTFTNQNGEREADFINVVIWDKQAENVAKYLTKGRLVAVEGRIQTRNYDNNEGKKVYVTEVVALSVQFLESKGSNTNVNNSSNPFDNMVDTPNTYAPIDEPSKQNETVDVSKDPFESFGQSIDLSDDDLPF
ncbi:MAG: single-stranded DNA-binding protein [Bacilli bacterium]